MRYNATVTALVEGKEAFPHLRMGQLILNAIPEDRLFYITDEEFVKAIWAYIKEHSK